MWLRALLIPGLLLVGPPARAQGPCDGLRGDRRALRDALLSAQHPYDCCDETIAECLRKPKPCGLAARLRDDICRRIARGEKRIEIERALTHRAQTMLGGGKTATIDLSSAPAVGEGSVTIALYLCARCPLCAKLTPEVHRAVTEGPLRGKARLFARLYPTKGHQDSALANVGFQAAHVLGRFWPYALHVFGKAPAFSPEKQREWAKAVGLDLAAFDGALRDPTNREAVVASKKEGIVNGVTATPTLFINGRRYTADLDIETIQDIVLEEHERVAGRQ